MENNPHIGPFFYLNRKLIFNAVPLSEGREQADKLDNSYGHDRLWDDNHLPGDYIYSPRGRVVWDRTNSRAIIYIDRCINRPNVIKKIADTFHLTDYVVRHDDHYRCRKCTGDIFDD